MWPYGGLQLTDRLSAWGALGYGAGELRLTPGGGGPFTADLTMAMGAAGLRGEVLTPPPDGGLALAVKGDTRFTRTASEATKDADGGRLEAAIADMWLLRTGIEGSRRFVLGGDTDGMVLAPSFELGARLDGGDAETGLGVDLGGGLAFAAPRQGVALDLKGRGLIAHEASGFREWGASASLTWDPRPETDRGLALSLRQSWGGSPAGGMDTLLGRETLAGLAAADNGASAGRLEAELGYGIAMFDGGFTGTPNLGVGFSETARDYRVGWRLTSARKGDPGFRIDLDATRREAANADAEHGLMLRGTIPVVSPAGGDSSRRGFRWRHGGGRRHGYWRRWARLAVPEAQSPLRGGAPAVRRRRAFVSGRALPPPPADRSRPGVGIQIHLLDALRDGPFG